MHVNVAVPPRTIWRFKIFGIWHRLQRLVLSFSHGYSTNQTAGNNILPEVKRAENFDAESKS
jgi:hypothetical protein